MYWVDYEMRKGSLPFEIPTAKTPTYAERMDGASGKITVTAEDYATVNRGLVLDELDFIRTVFKIEFDFRTTLMRVCDEISSIPDETLVKEFGRAYDNRMLAQN